MGRDDGGTISNYPIGSAAALWRQETAQDGGGGGGVHGTAFPVRLAAGLAQAGCGGAGGVGFVHGQNGYACGALQGAGQGCGFAGLGAGLAPGVVGDADYNGDGAAPAGLVQDGGDIGAEVPADEVSGRQNQRAGGDCHRQADAAVADVQAQDAAGLGQLGRVNGGFGRWRHLMPD